MTIKFRRSRKLLVACASVVVIGGASAFPALANLNLWAGEVAQVAFTGGEGINVRYAPGLDSGVISTLPEMYSVTVMDGPVSLDDGSSWYEISSETAEGWVSGWVSADYLAVLSTGSGETVVDYYGPPPTPDDIASGTPLWVATGGDALNIRSGPSAAFDIVGSAPDGAEVEVLDVGSWDDEGNRWTPVSYGGITGYALSAYLGQWLTLPTTGPVVELAGSTEVMAGQTAWITDGVNVRQSAGTDAGIITTIMAGNAVYVVDGPAWDANGDAWYQIEFDGLTGWVYGAYLSGGSGVPVNTGNALVEAALAYQGVPYVWGGQAPDGFDCSGFTYFIVNQVLGIDYPRPMEDQLAWGSYVAPENLQPGDVVYFQNTYQWGYSHMGFYMGDGQFVHAGTEHGGVGVSSLYDPYWQSRYIEARRVQ